MSSPDTTPPSPDIVDRLALMLERQVLAPDVVDDARREIERLRGEAGTSDETFARVIARAAWVGGKHVDDVARAVLATPEMQAIRAGLRWAHDYYGDGYLESDLGLPPAVVSWVLAA